MELRPGSILRRRPGHVFGYRSEQWVTGVWLQPGIDPGGPGVSRLPAGLRLLLLLRSVCRAKKQPHQLLQGRLRRPILLRQRLRGDAMQHKPEVLRCGWRPTSAAGFALRGCHRAAAAATDPVHPSATVGRPGVLLRGADHRQLVVRLPGRSVLRHGWAEGDKRLYQSGNAAVLQSGRSRRTVP
jgi:hypothetical protein